eukprot:1193941-Prorocentrum_minimum.AAC.5
MKTCSGLLFTVHISNLWTLELIKCCDLTAHPEYPLTALQLENNFRGQFSVTALHIWLSLARLREEGADGKRMSQVLYDIWWEDVQKRVRDEGVCRTPHPKFRNTHQPSHTAVSVNPFEYDPLGLLPRVEA